LQNYLVELDCGLRPLALPERAAQVREVRAHLEEAVAARREAGATDADAQLSAIAQFGHAEDLARTMVEAWRRREKGLNRRGFWSAAALLLALNWALTLIALVLLGLAHRSTGGWHTTNPGAGLIAVYLFTTAATGYVTGRIFPRRAARAALCVVAATYLFSFRHLSIGHLSVGHWLLGTVGFVLAWVITMLFTVAMNVATFGLPTILAAWAGSWVSAQSRMEVAR